MAISFEDTVLELVKIVGGIAWVVGLVMLFVVPTAGILILALAIALTIVSVNRTREHRHKELLAAAQPRQTPEAQKPPDLADRLDRLDRLREAGKINDDEYASLRQQILDSL